MVGQPRQPPVRRVVANNSGRATGVAMGEEDKCPIDCALILATLAHLYLKLVIIYTTALSTTLQSEMVVSQNKGTPV